MLCGFLVYGLYTIITYETASQAKQILADFTGYYWTISCQREILCQMFTNKKAEKFLHFLQILHISITLIWLQEIVLCIKPWNNSTLWVLCDIWWLIWNIQVPEQYLGQNILINSNICGFSPFPSAIWNGKLLTCVIKVQRWI